MQRGYNWQQARHHAIICDAMHRVYNGECKRLIINIPPRYSKSELAVKCFMAWALGKNPDSEFIHSSYSGRLAANNSYAVRGLVQEEFYREIFPEVILKGDSKAKDEWRTDKGGCVYAVGAGGTITGYGAGKVRDGFGGCFPTGTMVWTERGLIAIDAIVKERMAINVWSYNYAGSMVLKPITAWHKNPPNDIVRITFDDGNTVECTPDHKFWSETNGWVRADLLSVNDRLPCVNSGIKSFNDISINTNNGGSWLDSKPVFSASSIFFIVKRNARLLLSKYCSKIGLYSSFINNRLATRDRFPRASSPNLVNYCARHAIAFCNIASRNAFRVVDSKSLIVSKYCNRMNSRLAECAMNLAVYNIGLSAIISQVTNVVVSWIPVCVTNIKSFWPLSNKSKHHKIVDLKNFCSTIAGKAYSKIVHSVIWLKNTLRLNVWRTISRNNTLFASDSSEAANGVQPFIFGHRKPLFIDKVRHDEVTFCLTVKDNHNFTIESGLVVKNCIILDDMHKADEARSEVMRNNVIEWFQNTLESRKNSPHTPIIVIMQRLHENDLAGWLLAGNNGEQWEHIKIPAINPDGTALWPEKHSIEKLKEMEYASPYVFSGQYMQDPSPSEGGLFKPDQLQIIDAIPAGKIAWCRGWDLASVVTGDWTAGVKLGKMQDGRFIIADVVKIKALPDERDAAIKNTAMSDGRGCIVSLPQDPGQAGKSQVLYLTRSLAGFRVKSSTESGDKVTRAEPIAAQVNAGNVLLLRGEWNQSLKDEMRFFPFGNHDDQVDALSRASMELMGKINSLTTTGLSL